MTTSDITDVYFIFSNFNTHKKKMKEILKELLSTYIIVLVGFLVAGIINVYVINL